MILNKQSKYNMNNETEEIVEGLLNAAMDNGGEVLFSRFFKETPSNIKDVNLLLQMYGTIHGKMIGGSWTCFTINPSGIAFLKNGGFKGEQEAKENKSKMELLDFEIKKMQKDRLEYEKKIRHQENVIRLHKYVEAVSWLISILLGGILAFVKS